MATVVLLGTLDTKGLEYDYLRDRLRESGVDVLLVDAGVLEPVAIEPDIARDEVARGGRGGRRGARRRRRPRRGGRGDGRAAPRRSSQRLHAEGRLDGIARARRLRRLVDRRRRRCARCRSASRS